MVNCDNAEQSARKRRKALVLQLCEAHDCPNPATVPEFVELMTASNWMVAKYSPELIDAFRAELGNLETVEARRYLVQDMLGAWTQAERNGGAS